MGSCMRYDALLFLQIVFDMGSGRQAKPIWKLPDPVDS
jgi:hypothetical protein